MAKGFEFYLILDGEAPENKERFQKSLTTCYVNGIEPIEYTEEVLTDDDDKVVRNVTMLKCRTRWNGAAKRFFKWGNFTYTNQKYEGLPVFG